MVEQAVEERVMQGEQPEPEAEAEADGAGEAAPQAPGVAVEQLPQLLEAVLFVADGPVEEAALARALGVTRRQLGPALEALGEVLRTRGVRLLRGPEGAQLVTAPQAAWAIEQFLGVEAGRRLSTAALETLAIIAYRQPIVRAQIEAIRGVACGEVLRGLLDRRLVRIVGRAEELGRPMLYGTTKEFLSIFGLASLSDLPQRREFGESPSESTSRKRSEEPPTASDPAVESI